MTADEAVIRLYGEQARPLQGLAAVLVWLTAWSAAPLLARDPVAEGFVDLMPSGDYRAAEFATLAVIPVPRAVSGVAEEIVHDAFAAMHREWRRLRDADRAVAYLRWSVVRESRARSREPARARPQSGDFPAPAAQEGGMPALSARLLTALRRLPGRQCEALVLRYYADLSEANAAAAMGISRAAFRGHASRGMTALRLQLAQGR